MKEVAEVTYEKGNQVIEKAMQIAETIIGTSNANFPLATEIGICPTLNDHSIIEAPAQWDAKRVFGRPRITQDVKGARKMVLGGGFCTSANMDITPSMPGRVPDPEYMSAPTI